MIIIENGFVCYEWKVFMVCWGYFMLVGSYLVKLFDIDYCLCKYYNLLMFYLVFFKGGYVVYGMNEVCNFGCLVLYGCVCLYL